MASKEFRVEFESQVALGERNYKKLVKALDEDTLVNGEINDDDFILVLSLVGEPQFLNDHSFYDFLSVFWTLPEASTLRQKEELCESLIKLPKLEISKESSVVLVDALEKLSNEEKFGLYLNSIETSPKMAEAIRFARRRHGR